MGASFALTNLNRKFRNLTMESVMMSSISPEPFTDDEKGKIAEVFDSLNWLFKEPMATVDEKMIVVSKVFEALRKQFKQPLKNKVFSRKWLSGNRNFNDLIKALENADPNTLCVKEFYEPIHNVVRRYRFKSGQGGLAVIPEQDNEDAENDDTLNLQHQM